MKKIKINLSRLIFLALLISTSGFSTKVALASSTLAISITNPIVNSTLSGTVAVSAVVTAGNAAIQSVQYYVDSNAYGNPILTPASNSTYSLSMDTTTISNGFHLLSAVVTDSSSATATAANVGFTVNNATAYAAPAVSITAAETNTSTALNNGAYSGYVTLSANVTAGSANIQSVQFLLNGSDLSTGETVPTTGSTYTYNWNTSSIANGQYTVSAAVVDTTGHSVNGNTLTLTVNNSIVYGGILSAQITAPASGVTIYGTNKLVAYVKQGGPAIQSVQFMSNAVDLGTAVTTPDTTITAASGYSNYSYSWDTTTVANGTYAITALVTDVSAQTYTTPATNVYVGNSTSVISIIAPINTATVSGTTLVQTSVKVGTSTIKNVQLALNGTSLGSAITAVDSNGYYSYNWDTTQTTNGSYTLTAAATDNAGLISNATATISVNNAAATPPVVGTPSISNQNPSSNAVVHANGSLVVINGTYYEIENGKLLGITSPAILSSLGYSFSDAVPANTADQQLTQGSVVLPSDGSLISSVGDPTVYLVSGQQRHPFVSGAVFTGLGYSFASVLNVDPTIASALPSGSAVSDSAVAHLVGTDVSNKGTVYWIDSNGLHPYTSLDIYNSWHVANDFSKVVPANAADLALPMVSPVVVRVKATL